MRYPSIHLLTGLGWVQPAPELTPHIQLSWRVERGEGSLGEGDIRNGGRLEGGIPQGAAFPWRVGLYQEQREEEGKKTTGTDKGAVKTKQANLAEIHRWGGKVREKWDTGNHRSLGI